MAQWKLTADYPPTGPDYQDNAGNSEEQQGALETWVNVADDLKTRGATDDEVLAQLAHKGCPQPDQVVKMWYQRAQGDTSVAGDHPEEDTNSDVSEAYPPSPQSEAPQTNSLMSHFHAFLREANDGSGYGNFKDLGEFGDFEDEASRHIDQHATERGNGRNEGWTSRDVTRARQSLLEAGFPEEKVNQMINYIISDAWGTGHAEGTNEYFGPPDQHPQAFSKMASATGRYDVNQMPNGFFRVDDKISGLAGIYTKTGSGSFEYRTGDLRGLEQTITRITQKTATLKGSPYPENSYKNAPDHSAPGHHLPEKVNAIYNAVMRENPEYGKEKAMKIAWERSGLSKEKKGSFKFRNKVGKVEATFEDVWGTRMVRFAYDGGVAEVPEAELEPVETEQVDPVAYINDFVNTIPEAVDRATAQDRVNMLTQAHIACANAIVNGKLSLTDKVRLDNLALSAKLEAGELKLKLADTVTDEEQAYVDSLPKFEIGEPVASEFGAGGSDGWLDQTFREIEEEAASRDYDQGTDEIAAEAVSQLDGSDFADTHAARRIAESLLRTSSLTTGASSEKKTEVHDQLLEKVEALRQLNVPKIKARMAKTASEDLHANTPDEALWL